MLTSLLVACVPMLLGLLALSVLEILIHATIGWTGCVPPVCAECLVPSLSVVKRDHEVTTMG